MPPLPFIAHAEPTHDYTKGYATALRTMNSIVCIINKWSNDVCRADIP